MRETAGVAMIAGVAIALSAMLAVPGPADAAETMSLDFITKFLASDIPTCLADFCVPSCAGILDRKADVDPNERRTRYSF